MKKTISLVLAVVLLLQCSTFAFAVEDSGDYKTVSVEVEFSDNVGKSEYLTLMLKDNNVYVSATELALRFGYAVLVQDEYVAIYNDTSDELPFGITVFLYNSTSVSHSVFSQVIDDYEAPFPSIKNGNDAWIPFEFALMILGSSFSVINNALCIDIPEKTIVDIFYTVMKNRERYSFDWTEDFGYSYSDMEVIGISSHLINVFNGILKFDGDSWLQLFQAFANDTSAYESKYGEDIALLLCTESDKELAAETKKIKKIKDLLSSDGKIGKMLSQYSNLLDTDATAWANTCEAILNEVQHGNSSLAQYNKAYQALEKALDKQTWFSNTGGTILEVQKGVQSALPFLDAALTVLEVVGYGEEFQNQDTFSVDALNTVLLNLEEGSITFDAMQSSMLDYTKYLQTNAIAYSTKRYFDENIDSWIKKALGITELLGTQANIELLAWSLISSFIPRLSDSLSAADKFELALYSTVFSMDMFIDYQGLRNEVFSDEKNIMAENLYTVSQYCYIYLKSCYVTREAALASLKGKSYSIQEQIQPLIDEQNAINEEIAELLVILKDANKTNDGLVYGFLPSDNDAFLASHDSSALISVFEFVDYSNLITDAYATEFTGEYGDCLFAIPQINIAGGAIEAVNKEIWDELYVGVVEEIQTNLPYAGGEYIKYDWAVNGDNLSLWIESHPVDWAWWDYYVYNISISDRALISKESLLNSYGLGISEYNELVRKALYSSAYSSLSVMVDANPDLGTVAFANEILSNTTSDANVAEARPFFDKNGCLCIVGLVYSPAGADAYYYIINLEDFEVAAEYPDQFALSAGQQNVLVNILGDWTDGYTEYRFFANETFEQNTVFFSSTNRQLVYRDNTQRGVIEVTGINTADLAPYVQPGSLQTWMELIYDSKTDTIYVGNTSHPYYREDVWISGNIPEVSTPPVVEKAPGNTYGDNVSWTITDGVLRATGVGKMENYAKAIYVPWYDERGKVASVIMESGITTVGSYAFDGFGKLTSVSLPDTIRSIEEFAFWRCDDLPSIVIPSGCSTIKNSAFNWCESLEYIVLPTSVTEIMWNAFANCENLYDVYYSGTEEQWRKIDISSTGNTALTEATIHFNSTGPG